MPPATEAPEHTGRPEGPGRALRNRLLLLLLAPLLLVLVVSFAVDYRTALEPSNAAYDHALADTAVAIGSRLVVRGERIDVDLPKPVEALLVADQVDKIYYKVIGPDGRRLAGNADLVPDVSGFDNPRFTDGVILGRKVRLATYRDQTAAGVVTVVVAETVDKRTQTASRIAAAMVTPSVILAVATLAIVYFGVSVALKPLHRLSEHITQRSPRDLHPLPLRDIPLEAQPLVTAINGLMADLRAAATAQEAFLANAAHQLRTPLAGLQTQLDLAAQDLPAEHRERIARVRDGVQRLGHLAHQLLSLARSGPEAALAHEHQRLEIDRLLEELAPQFLDAAVARNIDLGVESASAVVEGSRWLLREMISNLLDNALRYTPQGGRVTARCGVDDAGRPFLEVEDNGPGIPFEDRERVFDRFYRPAGAAGTGAGLGLAIVREVADRHGAAIALPEPTSGSGTRIRVSFPARISRTETPESP